MLTEDGSAALINFSWSGWESSTAHAAGILSASNCTPNYAQGKRSSTSAQMALSSPGDVFGHTVYRFVKITMSSTPKSNQHSCLGPLPGAANAYGYIADAARAMANNAASHP